MTRNSHHVLRVILVTASFVGFISTAPAKEAEWFQLKSRLNGKVLGVSLKEQQAAPVRMWDSIDNEFHQLWYFDQEKIIHSVATNFCLTFHGVSPISVTVEKCDNMKSQKWTILDGKIINVNNPKYCLDIHRNGLSNGARVVVYECHGGGNQLWDLVEHKSIPSIISTVSPINENGPVEQESTSVAPIYEEETTESDEEYNEEDYE